MLNTDLGTNTIYLNASKQGGSKNLKRQGFNTQLNMRNYMYYRNLNDTLVTPLVTH